MSEMYSTGVWRPKAGRDQEFISEWKAFADWACTMPGAGTLSLTRDTGDPGRYLSMGHWGSEDAMQAWTASPDFRERLGRVLQHVDGFDRAALQVMATAAAAATAGVPTAGETR